MEGVIEDDVFFADISKQISLLIMDDDDHQHHLQYHHHPPVSFQEFSRGITQPSNTQLPAFCEQTTRRESKGTGVFIPHNSYSPNNNTPRRRRSINRQATTNFSSTKSQSQSHNNYSNLPPPNQYHYTITPNAFYNSINPNIC